MDEDELKSLKKHLTMMKNCKRGVCWKIVRQPKGEENQSSVTSECEEQAKFELKENHLSEG